MLYVHIMKREWNVSVPYRGATFLNELFYPVKVKGGEFPSPIGELHFSMYLLEIVSVNIADRVSVPYRGATFLNTIPATPCPVWDE